MPIHQCRESQKHTFSSQEDLLYYHNVRHDLLESVEGNGARKGVPSEGVHLRVGLIKGIDHEPEIRQTNLASCTTPNDEDTHIGELWVGHPIVVLVAQSGFGAASLAHHFVLEGCKCTSVEWANLVDHSRDEAEVGGNVIDGTGTQGFLVADADRRETGNGW